MRPAARGDFAAFDTAQGLAYSGVLALLWLLTGAAVGGTCPCDGHLLQFLGPDNADFGGRSAAFHLPSQMRTPGVRRRVLKSCCGPALR